MKSKIKIVSTPLKALVLGLYFAGGSVLAQTLPLPRNLIAFNSAEGEKLLLESKAQQDYWPLSIHFVTQNNQAYCGRCQHGYGAERTVYFRTRSP